MMVTSWAVLVTFHVGVSRAEMAKILQAYDDYRGQSSNLGEAERARGGGGGNIDALFEKDLL